MLRSQWWAIRASKAASAVLKILRKVNNNRVNNNKVILHCCYYFTSYKIDLAALLSLLCIMLEFFSKLLLYVLWESALPGSLCQ